MKTLDEALLDLENWVSGMYREPFMNSELRKNTKDNIDFIKFNLGTILNAKKKEVQDAAFENILDLVLDDHPIGKQWNEDNYFTHARNSSYIKPDTNRGQGYAYYIRMCLEDCDIIIKRLDEENTDDNDTMSIKELNDKYYHKYLFFNGDESGAQYVYVENIHKNKDGYFEIDGIMIDYDLQENTINVYTIENKPVEEFYYFGDDCDPYEKCSDLDNALMSRPLDTELDNHILSAKEVAQDIINIIEGIFEYGTGDVEIPELADILSNVKV